MIRTMFTYQEVQEAYEVWLNDTLEPVTIANQDYAAGYALKMVDEDTFRENCWHWCTREYREVRATEMTVEELEHYDMKMYLPIEDDLVSCAA